MPPKRRRDGKSDDASRKTSKITENSAPGKPSASTNAPGASGTTNSATPPQKLKVYVFGEGTAGELGLGNVKGAEQAKVPRVNHKLENIVAVTAGGMHGVAIDLAGQVLTWGGNDEFALGRETPDDDSDEPDDAPGLNANEATPTPLHTIPKRVVQVAAGDSCTFALTEDGHVYGWGTFRNKNGPYAFTFDKTSWELVDFQKEPVLVAGLENITQICAGADFALALDTNGRVFGWGPNEQGETGYRLTARHHHPGEALLPHLVPLPRTRIASVHSGISHAFAIDVQGRVWAWGLNNYGQTGIATGAGSNQPVIPIPQRVRSLDKQKIKSVIGGTHHSLALTQDGTCLVWGRIDGGQSGLESSSFKDRPSSEVIVDESGRPRILIKPKPLPIPPCSVVAAGTDHSIAVTESGKAYSWGLNASTQCGQGTDEDIDIAELMKAKSISEERVVFATAGGQFSMIACSAD